MLGMATTWRPEERAAGDYYTTDPTAVQQFLDVAQIDKAANVWEPACGCGNISEVLIDNGYNVLSTDLHNRGYGNSGIDFLLFEPHIQFDIDVIITNPPYSLANEFILKAMDILQPHGAYYALMNISYLSGQNRFKAIYDKGYLQAVYIYSHRIHCYKNGIITEHSSPVNYAWYEFSPIKNNKPTITWITK